MIELMLAQSPDAKTHTGTFWMPDRASSFAGEMDWVFYFIYWVSAFFFVLIAGLMFYFMVRYRQRQPGEMAGSDVTHNTSLEVAWTVIPSLLLVFMFWWGFTSFMEMRTPPPDTYDVNVVGQKWKWTFQYPNGIETDELHCWVDKPVKLTMRSTDVLHSLFIPAFRAKRDVVPGRFAMLWFSPTKVGSFRLYCAEYCGTSHSDMNAVVVVHDTKQAFDDWLATADPIAGLSDEQYAEFLADPMAFLAKYEGDPEVGPHAEKLKQMGGRPVDVGARLYVKRGCNQCHSTDGTAGTGPTWRNLWGTTEQLTDGSSVTVDENYVMQSIQDPGAQIVQGYQNVMPKTPISDREVTMLIAYIKSLSDESAPQ